VQQRFLNTILGCIPFAENPVSQAQQAGCVYPDQRLEGDVIAASRALDQVAVIGDGLVHNLLVHVRDGLDALVTYQSEIVSHEAPAVPLQRPGYSGR